MPRQTRSHYTLSELERSTALDRYRIILPFLEGLVPLSVIAREKRIPLRTAQHWIERYRKAGISGLERKSRSDKEQPKIPASLREVIEGLALQRPRRSIRTIHRTIIKFAQQAGQRPPSYSYVYKVIRDMQPGLLTLAHDGPKAYENRFDLIHRTEAKEPNAIWQADHAELDFRVKDADGTSHRPWLTIILDDYSRAVAGYMLFLSDPSALQTALALRQAIWRKSQSGWHICGIPQVLYTDHGSDFTSHHIEEVALDLKIQLIFSTVARPRGRGKIERFFRTLTQILLSRLPGYAPQGTSPAGILTLTELANEIEQFIVKEYLVTPHSETGVPPQERWEAGGFLPNMAESLEQLDLLLLTVPKVRRIHPDGIRFMGMRYIDPALAAYVGEDVLLRYDPRDMALIRIFHQNRFICRAICQELAGETIALRDIIRARRNRHRELRATIKDRIQTVESLLESRRWTSNTEEPPHHQAPQPKPGGTKLKRYLND